ncbi:hypothetical protein GE09DRAFT_1052422 [Coniochaeta sp. 2T2.1]|nr:hypothetical protein GE09DRAFT_1052422 [Coniochaeta sp. 2T2.1]
MRTDAQLALIWANRHLSGKEIADLYNKAFPSANSLTSKDATDQRWRLRKNPRFNWLFNSTELSASGDGGPATAGGDSSSAESGDDAKEQDTPNVQTRSAAKAAATRRSKRGRKVISDDGEQDSDGNGEHEEESDGEKDGEKNGEDGEDDEGDRAGDVDEDSEDDDNDNDYNNFATQQPGPQPDQGRRLRTSSGAAPQPRHSSSNLHNDGDEPGNVTDDKSPASQVDPARTAGQASPATDAPAPLVPRPEVEGHPLDIEEHNGRQYHRGAHGRCTINGSHRHRVNGEVAFPSAAAVNGMVAQASGYVNPRRIDPFADLPPEGMLLGTVRLSAGSEAYAEYDEGHAY